VAGGQTGGGARCGDGRLDAGEECDDGDGANGTTSPGSADCAVRCEAGLLFADAVPAKAPTTKHCYALVPVGRTFDEAAQACELGPAVRGFRLASLRSLAELDLVRGRAAGRTGARLQTCGDTGAAAATNFADDGAAPTTVALGVTSWA
jgi:hypothetical protein